MTDASSSDATRSAIRPVPPVAPPPVAPRLTTPPAAPGATNGAGTAMPLPGKIGDGPSPPTRRTEGLAPVLPTPRRDTEQRRLIVGREISLTGEITACERLIVEGSVEANLNNCREVEIAESGMMKGTAAIEEAEIRGRFEGSLTVRKRLFIRATGKVTGTVRYGQLEIECGGQISGDIQAQPGAEEEPRHDRVVGLPGEMKL